MTTHRNQPDTQEMSELAPISDPPETTSHSTTPQFIPGSFSVDEYRPMKVVVIGAGYSGIIAGIRFLQRVPNVYLTIYEQNTGIGGTWFVNKYPGIACDIPSHIYQLTFEQNPNWSSFYCEGLEILAYLESVVAKYKLMPYIKLQHRLAKAEYSESTGRWKVTVQRTGENGEVEEFEDTGDILFTGIGALSRWSWPDIEGLTSFQGKIIHSADWNTGEGTGNPRDDWKDSVASWRNKRVGVIGVGSSAIQIVPAIQPHVAHLVNYARGKTWVAASFVRDVLVRLAGDENANNYTFTDEEKLSFADPQRYKRFRKDMEDKSNAIFMATMIGHPMQAAGTGAFKNAMIAKLAKKPWIGDKLIPDFAVGCRRLTPGPGYLEALCEDNVDFISDPIKRITPTGIETVDGKYQDLDIIVCATGFDVSYKPGFPIIGRGGIDLNNKFTPHPRTYLSITVDGFPNFFQALGPNAGLGGGNLVVVMEKQVDYAVAVTLKLQRERLKSIEVKKEAVDEFDEYLESYFPKTVFGSRCKSWYKVGKEEGRIVALWPGSGLHIARALTHPRWEDYNYEPFDTGVKNRFYWLGDGLTVADKTDGVDKAWYLDDSEIDIPPIRD